MRNRPPHSLCIAITIQRMEIGVVTENTMIGRNPNGIATLQDIGDIQAEKRTQLRGNLLAHQLAVFLCQPVKPLVNP